MTETEKALAKIPLMVLSGERMIPGAQHKHLPDGTIRLTRGRYRAGGSRWRFFEESRYV